MILHRGRPGILKATELRRHSNQASSQIPAFNVALLDDCAVEMSQPKTPVKSTPVSLDSASLATPRRGRGSLYSLKLACGLPASPV